jgi:hypothetical protein
VCDLARDEASSATLLAGTSRAICAGMDGRDVKAEVDRAAQSPWMERARAVGFVAKGVVYAVIGIYALLLALGKGGGFLDVKDAPRAVQHQPYGDVLLVALAIGLACHALYRFVEAIVGRPAKSAMKRLGKRVASFSGGAVSAFLSVTAFQHLAGRSHANGSWIQRVLRWDGGDWVVLAVGVGFLVAGGHQIYRAVTDRYRKHIHTHELPAGARTWVLRICRFGVAARGGVLLVVGYLLVRAGMLLRDGHAIDTRRASGTGAALRTIMKQPWGTWLLGVAAAGLIAYALYMCVTAKYRRAFA